MSEMVDNRMDAKLEWEHAQNLHNLLRTFGLSSVELSEKLDNPNLAVPSKGALWITLSFASCKAIHEALLNEGVNPQI